LSIRELTDMHENILAALIRIYKAKTFFIIPVSYLAFILHKNHTKLIKQGIDC